MSETTSMMLEAHEAYREAVEWARRHDDPKEAWDSCERGDWMLWWAAKFVDRKALVLAACDCAEPALRFVPDGEDRPRVAIETARKWARDEGGVTLADVRAAAYAASAASAAYAAAYAAFAANTAAYADAAFSESYRQSAKIVRSHFPEVPMPEGVSA